MNGRQWVPSTYYCFIGQGEKLTPPIWIRLLQSKMLAFTNALTHAN